MKKLLAITFTFWALTILSPFMPAAHAAFIEDRMSEVLAQDPNAARVQELLKSSTNNKGAVLGSIAQAVLQKTGNQNVINVLSNGNPSQTIQDAVRREAVKRVEDKLGPYQKEIGIITTLFKLQPNLSPNVMKDNNSLTGAPQNYKRVLDMTATAYAPGTLDNGKWNDKTYVGGLVQKGVVAVDPNVIPMGTKLWVEGYGEALAVDQGSAIKGNRIDLAFNSRAEALDYGIKKVKVYELN